MSAAIQDLISGYIDDSLSREQLQELSEWINFEPSNARQFASALLLHDRLRNHFIAHEEQAYQQIDASSLVAPAKASARQWRAHRQLAWATTACLVLVATLFFWQTLGARSASAAMRELNRIMIANDRSIDRTFEIAVETTSAPQGDRERTSPEHERPPKPSLDQAILDVRGARQFVLTRKTEQGDSFITGSNGVTSWAVRPDGPVRFSNDLTRFNRDLPGHECSLPINNLHDGLDALRTAYDLTLLPALTTDSVDDPSRRMVAVKKPGYRGPAEVEITYDSANGQIRKMRFVAMPYGVDNVTLTMTLVAERELPANHFDHQTHHAPLRRVEFE
ncbi:hypothetical protein [Allorhodopirellula heiligendammensis]|uniref:Uncharacterized protein n=1 Tax=Allorhodopirellula heiligendammensis TaxID=2714739 RepID=A0A5C6BX05_9BACT|nr:hypothetical protein [Allorhodopirellula heiligendammensis]TWU16177.1 hypothetical protein Poly21_33820 [Allorhodopirellula heiligendammensis]